MRTLTLTIMVVALVGLFAASAGADFPGTRVMGMGFARVGVADGSSAFLDNPAGLPRIHTFGMRLSPWPIRASANMSVDSDVDRYSILGSARNSASTQGFGAGYWRSESANWEVNYYGAGYGAELGLFGLTGGLSAVWQDMTYTGMMPDQNGLNDQFTVVNAGLMKQFPGPLSTWKVGLLARDLADELGNGITFDVGASVRLPPGLLLAADINDIADESDTSLNIGAEWPLPMTPFTVRAGLVDDEFTAGAGYTVGNWEVNAAWVDAAGDGEAVVGVTGCF